MDYTLPALQTAGTVSHKGTAHDRGHSLAGRVTNQEVLDRAGSTGIESMLLKPQLPWTGHVMRMTDSRIPRQLLYGGLMCGSRKQGRPKLRSKDSLKNSYRAVLAHVNLRPLLRTDQRGDPSPHEQQLPTKRAGVASASRCCKIRTVNHRAASASTRTTDCRCDTCGRLCASSFGVQSRMRSHR